MLSSARQQIESIEEYTVVLVHCWLIRGRSEGWGALGDRCNKISKVSRDSVTLS